MRNEISGMRNFYKTLREDLRLRALNCGSPDRVRFT